MMRRLAAGLELNEETELGQGNMAEWRIRMILELSVGKVCELEPQQTAETHNLNRNESRSAETPSPF